MELQNLSANSKAIAAYKNYITQSAKLFCGDKCDASILAKDVDEIINLEHQLAMNRMSPEKSWKGLQ